MTRFSVRNVKKAAQSFLDHSDEPLTLRLVSGIHGGIIKTKEYNTVNGLLKNSGRKVRCYFYRSSDGYSYKLMFEATY